MVTSSSWVNTTHDWMALPDLAHIAEIRRSPAEFAPGGLLHLVCEVLAYADDEAAATIRRGRVAVTAHPDGSISVSDDGRGTETRRDHRGRPVIEPIMSTRDLRFFDQPTSQLLPDGQPRRGMSVAAALSEWLVHTNRRSNGSWSHRYEHGVPTATAPTTLTDDGSTGTTVHFLPDSALVSSKRAAALHHRLTFDHLEIHCSSPTRPATS